MNLATPPKQLPDFLKLWKPQSMGFLFIVCGPKELSALDEKTYLELMQTRLDELIREWVNQTSLTETQQLLSRTLNLLDSAQPIPILKASQDDSIWRQEWANLLIHDNWRFQERMWHYGVTFPMTPINQDDESYPDLIEMHDETTLEEWLTTLTP